MLMFATLRATDEEVAILDETSRAVEEFHAQDIASAERRLVALLESLPGGLAALQDYDLARTGLESDRCKAVYALGRRTPLNVLRQAIHLHARPTAEVPLLGDIS